MFVQRRIYSLLVCLLLLATLWPGVQSRRGGGFGRGGGMSRGSSRGGWGGNGGANRGGWGSPGTAYRAPPVQTGGSSSGSSVGKVAGAAAAGALGGAVLGHGLSSMSRPGYGYGHGYGYGGYGGYGGGYGYGYPRSGGGYRSKECEELLNGEFRNDTDIDYYLICGANAGPTYGFALAVGAAMSFLLGHWLS